MTQDPSLHNLKPLWDALGRDIDQQRPPRHPDQEAHAFAQAATAQKTPRTLPLKLLACALLLGSLALLWWASPKPQAPPDPLQTAAAPPSTRVIPGEPLRAQPFAPQALTLDDGTQLVLEPHAHAQVDHLPGHTQVTLHQGVAHVRGTHTMAQTWQLRAGPYTVTLLGTAFEVGWSPQDQRFHLTLEEGQVQVEGPGLSSPRHMRPADSLVLHLPPPPEADLPQDPPSPPKTVAKSSPPPPRAPKWRALAKQKKYAQAMDAARDDGLETLCRLEPPSKLLELADVARFANRRAEASHVLGCLRTRKASAAQKATAAYLLGQVARQSGQPKEAIRWLSLYLKEAPKGPLVRETMGQLMDLYPPTQAQDLAKTYLQHFPQGPHATNAQRLLSPAP